MSPASPGAVAQGSCPVSWRPWDSAEDCSGWQGRSRAELCILSQRLPLGRSSPCEGPEALTAEGVSGGTVGGGGSTRVDSEDKALGTCDRQAVEGEQCRCPDRGLSTWKDGAAVIGCGGDTRSSSGTPRARVGQRGAEVVWGSHTHHPMWGSCLNT